jgi:hypothetical protein
MFGAQASSNADKFNGFADECMAEYDLDCCKVPDLSDPGELSYPVMRGVSNRSLCERPLCAAGSTGRCNTFRELVCWGLIEQGLSGPFIELPCYRAEFGLAMHPELTCAANVRKSCSRRAAAFRAGGAQLECPSIGPRTGNIGGQISLICDKRWLAGITEERKAPHIVLRRRTRSGRPPLPAHKAEAVIPAQANTMGV